MKNDLEGFDLSQLIPKKPVGDQVILRVKDPVTGKAKPLCARNNHSLITGADKFRSTLLTTFFIHELPKGTKAIIFDTKEGPIRCHHRQEMLIAFCPSINVTVYNLRSFSIVQRKKIIERVTIEDKPTFIVIDDIADLIADNNHSGQAAELVAFLEHIISLSGHPHVMNVLDTGKAGGTELEFDLYNKAENDFPTEKVFSTLINAFEKIYL